jgi:hypothetical protein
MARPSLAGKTVNRSFPGATRIEGVMSTVGTAQQEWNWADIVSVAGTDSVHWDWTWDSDSLIKGENFLCAVALESQGATMSSLGHGTPFAGNLCVYPIYRAREQPRVREYERNATPGLFLAPVFPNPASGLTRISFTLPYDSYVQLVVHDIAGRRVVVLVDQELEAGTHTVTWDGTDDEGQLLPAGVYLSTLKVNDYKASRKIVFIRTRE